MKCMPLSSNLKYYWEKRKGNFPSRANGVHSQTLTIVHLRPEDSGEYRCTVSNSTGSITSDYAQVVIQGIAITSTQIKHIYVIQ